MVAEELRRTRVVHGDGAHRVGAAGASDARPAVQRRAGNRCRAARCPDRSPRAPRCHPHPPLCRVQRGYAGAVNGPAGVASDTVGARFGVDATVMSHRGGRAGGAGVVDGQRAAHTSPRARCPTRRRRGCSHRCRAARCPGRSPRARRCRSLSAADALSVSDAGRGERAPAGAASDTDGGRFGAVTVAAAEAAAAAGARIVESDRPEGYSCPPARPST